MGKIKRIKRSKDLNFWGTGKMEVLNSASIEIDGMTFSCSRWASEDSWVIDAEWHGDSCLYAHGAGSRCPGVVSYAPAPDSELDRDLCEVDSLIDQANYWEIPLSEYCLYEAEDAEREGDPDRAQGWLDLAEAAEAA